MRYAPLLLTTLLLVCSGAHAQSTGNYDDDWYQNSQNAWPSNQPKSVQPYGLAQPLSSPAWGGQRDSNAHDGYFQDREQAHTAQQQAALSHSGRIVSWFNRTTGNNGNAKAIDYPHPGRNPGETCRAVEEHLLINGQTHRNRGLVCLPSQDFN